MTLSSEQREAWLNHLALRYCPPDLCGGVVVMETEWVGPPVYCTRCGLQGLVPVPAQRRGVPYWAIPVHRWPEDDFCTSGTQPLPGQYLPAPEGLL